MNALTRREFIPLLAAAPAAMRAFAVDAPNGSGWIPLFDGRSLAGWKTGRNTDSFRATDGQIVAHGPESYLFYTASHSQNANFKNFELTAEVRLAPGAQSGIYFHTPFQSAGEPTNGFR